MKTQNTAFTTPKLDTPIKPTPYNGPSGWVENQPNCAGEAQVSRTKLKDK